MKLDDKNIDQLFRDAAQNSSAPNYNASYWNDVSSMLNAEDRKRKALLFWALGGGAAVVVLFSILFINNEVSGESIQYTQGNTEYIKPTVSNAGSSNQLSQFNSSDVNSSSGFNSSRTFKENISSTQQIESNIIPSTLAETDDVRNVIEKEVKIESIGNEETVSSDIAVSKNQDTHLKNTSEKELDIIRSLPAKELDFVLTNSGDLISNHNTNSWSLALEINAGVMENYRTSRPFDSGLMGAALKGSYTKSNLIISSGIGVQASTNSDLVVSRRAKFYGFGVVNHQTDLSYQNMFDIYIPLEIGYKLNKTSFGMGLQANYLVNTSMILQKYEDNELTSSESISGYSNGLNKISAQGYIWISQQFGERFHAGLKVGTNFTNRIKEGDYFNESSTTNPIFGQVSLRYNLFK